MGTTPTRVTTTAIRTPTDDLQNHTGVLRQLKETTEVAQRLRGDPGVSFVRVDELVNAGIVRLVNGTVQPPNTNTPPGAAVPSSRQVKTADSLTGGGALSADLTLSLVNDQSAPGISKFYGTDGSGNRGWLTQPAPFVSPLTTKGDLFGHTASADARLPVGGNGTFLTADSTAATGLSWHTFALADIPSIGNDTVLGNVSGGSAVPAALSPTQLTALINNFSSTLPGSAPASGGGTTNFLRADGAWAAPAGGGGSGTVTSVALADVSTTPIYTITGSPVTASGTLDFALKTQSANSIFAGPGSGAAAQPGFRSLVAADIPAINLSSGVTGSLALGSIAAIANDTVLGNISGASAAPVALTQTQLTTLVNDFTASLSGAVPASGGGTTNFLRADGTWAAPAGGGSTGANPTAIVGLTAVNGSALTFMRSDAAPPIDQTIAPTWTGLHTFAPSAGNAIGINAAAGAAALSVNAAASSFASILLKGGLTGTNSWELLADGFTAGAFSIFSDLHAWESFKILQSGNTIQGRGPNAAALVDMTPDTGTFTGSFTGFTTTPTAACRWYRIGQIVMLFIPPTTGTSNTSAMTMTGLPAAIQTARAIDCPCGDGASGGSAVSGVTASIAAASGTVTFRLTGSTGGFSASSTKGFTNGTLLVYYIG